MNARNEGFGLIEIMVALVLGLLISLGVTQVFIASSNTHVSQNNSARMQEDARFVLSKMLQEIRMTGMYGCLSLDSATVVEGSIARPAAFSTPILWNNQTKTLTLITSDIGKSGAAPNWTIVSDCVTSTHIYENAQVPATGQTAFPLRQLTYTFSGSELTVATSGGSAQPLLSNINAFNVSFGIAGTPMTYTSAITAATSDKIRSVKIELTLTDPSGKARNQVYNVVAAVRNRF